MKIEFNQQDQKHVDDFTEALDDFLKSELPEKLEAFQKKQDDVQTQIGWIQDDNKITDKWVLLLTWWLLSVTFAVLYLITRQ